MKSEKADGDVRSCVLAVGCFNGRVIYNSRGLFSEDSNRDNGFSVLILLALYINREVVKIYLLN